MEATGGDLFFGDLFFIETEEKYPAEYRGTTDRAKTGQNDDARPELSSHVENMDAYDTFHPDLSGLGNTFNFLISYVKVKDFGVFWDKYVEHIETYNYPYELIDIDKRTRDEYNYTDIRTIQNRNGKKTTLDRICLKIME